MEELKIILDFMDKFWVFIKKNWETPTIIGFLSLVVGFFQLFKKDKNKKKIMTSPSPCYWNMGSLLKELKQDKLAVEKLTKSVEIQKELKNPDYQKNLAFLNDYKSSLN